MVFLGARYAHSDNNGTLILDGVPAGDYPLRVEQLGFERYERNIQLPPGKRNPIEITLTPVITVYTQGQVLENETGFPLAGAQIEMRPVDVKAAVKGKLNFFTDWEGRFKILGIPSGRYHLEILAEGCNPLESDINFDKDMDALHFELIRPSRKASLQVRVEDAESGKTIAAASVSLAGAGAQPEQTGYATRTFQGPAMVYLEVTEWGNNSWANSPYLLWAWFTPCGELDLISRNDTEETALPLELKERIRDTIFPLYDVDWYRLQIDHPGYLKLEIETPVQLFFNILDPKGKAVFSQGTQPGSADWRFPILPGEHLLQVTEWGNNDKSPVSYVFAATLDRVDSAEGVPLQSDSIRELRLGHAAPYAIEHLYDSDRYRFNIPQMGEFFIRLQLPVQSYIWLFDDRTGEKVWEGGQQAGYVVRSSQGALPSSGRDRLERGSG